MKKLFLFCLLASFALATNSFAGPGTVFISDCDGFEVCPTHAKCSSCIQETRSNDGIFSKKLYQMTGCESGYSRVGNKCIKEKIPYSGTHKIDEVITSKPITRTITTKRKK